MDQNQKITQEALIKAYYDAIAAHCNRKLGYDIDAAHDIAQDTFYELLSHWNQFGSKNEAGLLKWLYRTADILIKKHCRLQKKAEKYLAQQNEEIPDEMFQIDQNLIQAEEDQKYEAYIKEIRSKLSKKENLIFEHIIMQKYTVAQTAKLLGMKENTVMVSLYRLRKKLNIIVNKQVLDLKGGKNK